VNNADGGGNTAIGLQTLVSNTTGSSNVAIGNNALSNSTGDNNTALGFNAGSAVTTANNLICIGAFGANVDNSCFIGNIYSNVQPIVGTDPDSVTIASSGRLGRGNASSAGTNTTSSRWIKRVKCSTRSSQSASATTRSMTPRRRLPLA
jgi:hypothetical protein